MSGKHQSPEYQRNARIIRARVKTQHAAGEPVPCWRCRSPIFPGQPFDVGHIAGAQGSSQQELAPEHRHKTTHCKGNRSAGGTVGAAVVNARRNTLRSKVTAWPL